MIKKLLLKIIFNKEERRFIESSLYVAEHHYRDRYNNENSESYKSEILKTNIPKLIELREIFRKTF